MKKAINILTIIILVCILNSCEDNFDPQIYGTFNTTLIPSSVDDVENVVATCYLPFASFWNYKYSQSELCWNSPANGVLLVFDVTTDMMSPMDNWGSVTQRTKLSNAYFSDMVNYTRSGAGDNNINHMHGVSDVSAMTEYLDVINNCTVISTEQKAKYAGEIRLCRGLSMYNTLHCYGPLPFILNPEDLTNEEVLFDLERPSLDEVTEWITADFEYAVENIWTKDEIKQNGRYNKDYARVCLARHLLNEGYHMSGYYEKAAEILSQIITENNYSLFRTTTNINPYVDQFHSANGFNSEVIAAVDVVPANTNAVNGNYNAISIYCMGAHVLMNANYNPDFGIQGSAWGQFYNFNHKFYHTFEDGDLRAKCITTSYINKWDYTEITEDNISTAWWDGFIMNKYRPEVSGTYQKNDIPLARYADVLLLYAEALVRSTGTVNNDAINAVNEVRDRAGLAGLPAEATASVDSFLDALLLERGHELFFEGCRKIDLIRFNKYATSCAKYKGVIPTSQYFPLPNYAVNQASEHGCQLIQTYEREGYAEDLANAQAILN